MLYEFTRFRIFLDFIENNERFVFIQGRGKNHGKLVEELVDSHFIAILRKERKNAVINARKINKNVRFVFCFGEFLNEKTFSDSARPQHDECL